VKPLTHPASNGSLALQRRKKAASKCNLVRLGRPVAPGQIAAAPAPFLTILELPAPDRAIICDARPLGAQKLPNSLRAPGLVFDAASGRAPVDRATRFWATVPEPPRLPHPRTSRVPWAAMAPAPRPPAVGAVVNRIPPTCPAVGAQPGSKPVVVLPAGGSASRAPVAQPSSTIGCRARRR